MEYIIFLLEALAIALLSTLIFVKDEDTIYRIKFAIAVIIGISIFYNVNFLCECGRSFLGKCMNVSKMFSRQKKGTEMTRPSVISDRHRQLRQQTAPLARRSADEMPLGNPF